MADAAEHRFRTHRDGAAIVLDAEERGVLVHLFSELASFLSPEDDAQDAAPADPLAVLVGIGEDDEEPEDPALARLLPSAYPDDDEASAEFRRLTQDGLRARKLAATITVLESLHQDGSRVVLDAEGTQAWLVALTDLRLVLGSRLGVTTDPASQEWTEDELATDPRAGLLAVYDWLGFLQDTLVRVLTKRLDGAGDEVPD